MNELSQISKAYRRLNEALTIPLNPEDEIEKYLREKLPPHYKHADLVIRIYRAVRKRKLEDAPPYDDEYGKAASMKFVNGQLRMWVDNRVPNLIDELTTYDHHIAELQKIGAFKNTTRIEFVDDNFDKIIIPNALDLSSMYRPSIWKINSAVQYLGDILIQHGGLTPDKFTLAEYELGDIRLLEVNNGIAVWSTMYFDTTNKFIFNFWLNKNMNSRIGDPSSNSPYCTRLKHHWSEYSHNDESYQQFWLFKTVDGVDYELGDLRNPATMECFKKLRGTGPDTLVCMNDTFNDILDRYDEPPKRSRFFDGMLPMSDADATVVRLRKEMDDIAGRIVKLNEANTDFKKYADGVSDELFIATRYVTQGLDPSSSEYWKVALDYANEVLVPYLRMIKIDVSNWNDSNKVNFYQDVSQWKSRSPFESFMDNLVSNYGFNDFAKYADMCRKTALYARNNALYEKVNRAIEGVASYVKNEETMGNLREDWIKLQNRQNSLDIESREAKDKAALPILDEYKHSTELVKLFDFPE